MKRFMIAALMVVAGIGMASGALAGQFVGPATGFPHLVSEPVAFRVHKATAATGEILFSDSYCNTCAIDSLNTSRVGTQISILDTTVSVATYGWVTPVQNQALSDTSGFYCQFHVFDKDGASCESGADSLYIAIQASVDGVTWFTLPTFKAGTLSTITSRLDQTNVTGSFFGALSLNGAALANGAPVWKVLYKQRAVTSWDRNDVGNPGVWPFLRWIVGFPDGKGYKVSAAVSHLTTAN